MTNTNLKNRIEKATGLKISSSTYKLEEGNFEGYVSAYPADAEKVGRKYCGHSVKDGESFCNETSRDAVTTALIDLAKQLDVELPEEALRMVANRKAADFDART